MEIDAGVITMKGRYGGLPFTTGFEWSGIQTTTGSSRVLPDGSTKASFTTRIGAQQIRALTFEEGPLEEATEERVRTFTVVDEEPSLGRRFEVDAAGVRRKVFTPGLEPETTFGYKLFRSPSFEVQWILDTCEAKVERLWSTGLGMSAFQQATGRYGSGERLLRLLPEFHRLNDEPEPPDPRGGPLRRLLDVFGASLDQARSGAESLRSVH